MRGSSSEVADYYDRNTAAFLRFGQGGNQGAIHRAVWGPGAKTRAAAFDYVHSRLVEELDAVAAGGEASEAGRWVVDLGCGAGATLAYLLARRPVSGLGIGNSRVQMAAARRRLWAMFPGRVRLVAADFCSAPLAGPRAELCIAIESFVHAADPAAFFALAARLLRPRGRLVVCDDVILSQPRGRAERRCLTEVRRGWKMSALMTAAEMDTLAAGAGLCAVADEDLTRYLELTRPRDRWLAAMVGASAIVGLRGRIGHPWWSAWVGGAALRWGLRRGLLGYRYRVWQRDASSGAAS